MLYIITSFVIGAVLGFIGAWFVWKNNKNKWNKLEAKFDYAKYLCDSKKVAEKFATKDVKYTENKKQ